LVPRCFASFWRQSELPYARPPKKRRAKFNPALKLMKSLRLPVGFAIETLRRSALKHCLGKETIMLDVAFVALGCAVLALMGAYAFALRQL
jgi:hypothetical protein